MNRFFLKQHSFFNTYEEFGRLYMAAERHAHITQKAAGFPVSNARVRQSYLGLPARTLGSETFGTKKSILFCFLYLCVSCS